MALPPRGDASENSADSSGRGGGTGLANYTSYKSARGVGSKTGWGGARNSRSRLSESLSLHQARGIIRASQNAIAIGLPFNRHVTIHWERAGVADDTAARATGAFLTLVRDFLRKRGHRTAWAWVRENGDGKGSHLHCLLHVPAGVPWRSWRLRRWLERVTGNPYLAGTVRTSRVAGRTNAAETRPGDYQDHLAVVVAYVIKGASADAARALELERWADGGRIIGKRAGWSQNISTLGYRKL